MQVRRSFFCLGMICSLGINASTDCGVYTLRGTLVKEPLSIVAWKGSASQQVVNLDRSCKKCAHFAGMPVEAEVVRRSVVANDLHEVTKIRAVLESEKFINHKAIELNERKPCARTDG